MRHALLLLAVAGCALAQPVIKHAGTRLGPVHLLECKADAGLLCERTASTGTGYLSCAYASATEPGCVSLGTQSFAGNKDFNGNIQLADDGLYTANLWSYDTNPVSIGGFGVDGTGPVTSVRVGAWENHTNLGSHLLSVGKSFGTTYAEVAYVTPQGVVRGSAVEGVDGGWALESERLRLGTGASVPQSAQLCGTSQYGASMTAPLATNLRTVARMRAKSAGQFHGVVGTMLRSGLGDGGVAADGGNQTWSAGVYHFGLGAWLCQGERVDCNHVIDSFSDSYATCGGDGGALFDGGDLVDVAVDDNECNVKPAVTVCGEYQGLPDP